MKGIGVDMIEIRRIAELMLRKGDRLSKSVFTPRELECTKGGRYEGLAARFAAKEAVAKALGTGIKGFGWNDIEITESPSGAPAVVLHRGAMDVARRLGVGQVFVSLSHCGSYAIAFAIAVGGDHISHEGCDCRGNEGDRPQDN
ncbi:MAG TPA: holo-ACP synthase [Firmicutes bacterium]|nr:holo-ACP synthase [Bacillota bacterium]